MAVWDRGENVRPWGVVGVEEVKASVDKQMAWDSFGLPLTLGSGCYSWQSTVSFRSCLPGLESISLHQRLGKAPVTSGLETLPYDT